MGEAGRDPAAFRAVWLLARTRRGRHEPLPPLGPPAEHVAVVARLPIAIADVLAEAARGLATPPGSYLYPPATIHFTVRNLDGLADADVAAAAAVAAGTGFDVAARGLGLSPATVFVQLFPDGDALRSLRSRLDELGPPRRRPPGLADLAFANVVRFASRPPRRLVRSVGQHRRTEFGRWRVEQLELVRTDRYLSDAATVVLARIPPR